MERRESKSERAGCVVRGVCVRLRLLWRLLRRIAHGVIVRVRILWRILVWLCRWLRGHAEGERVNPLRKREYVFRAARKRVSLCVGCPGEQVIVKSYARARGGGMEPVRWRIVDRDVIPSWLEARQSVSATGCEIIEIRVREEYVKR